MTGRLVFIPERTHHLRLLQNGPRKACSPVGRAGLLAASNLVPETDCECGQLETVEHCILECRNFVEQRVALGEYIDGREWPEAARSLMTSRLSYEAFKH